MNALMLLATFMLSAFDVNLNQLLGLFHWSSDYFRPHQLVSYIFMHGGIGHLFMNMFALFMLGKILEQVWGPKRFLIYYMVTGIGAGLIQLIVTEIRLQSLYPEISPEDLSQILEQGRGLIESNRNYTNLIAAKINMLVNIPTVGASGAVFGILLAFGILFPNTELMLLFIPVPIKAKYFVIGYGVLELYLGFANNRHDNVAHFAHLGGMLFGYLLIRYWKKTTNTFY